MASNRDLITIGIFLAGGIVLLMFLVNLVFKAIGIALLVAFLYGVVVLRKKGKFLFGK